jgi:hypothetical protein
VPRAARRCDGDFVLWLDETFIGVVAAPPAALAALGALAALVGLAAPSCRDGGLHQRTDLHGDVQLRLRWFVRRWWTRIRVFDLQPRHRLHRLQPPNNDAAAAAHCAHRGDDGGVPRPSSAPTATTAANVATAAAIAATAAISTHTAATATAAASLASSSHPAARVAALTPAATAGYASLLTASESTAAVAVVPAC